MKLKMNSTTFNKEMNNIVDYAIGFLDGTKAGKVAMMQNFSTEIKEFLAEFIDSNARVNPDALHHVYEWYQTGSPGSRLFELDCNVSDGGISVYGTFTQSQSIQNGSKVPFYNKAEIMENGIPVKISPVNSTVLAFNDNGEQVFTRQPVTVDNPGGRETNGAFERVFTQFFNQYFTQAFLMQSKVMQHLSMPKEFTKNFAKAKRTGRSAGFVAGYQWMARAGK